MSGLPDRERPTIPSWHGRNACLSASQSLWGPVWGLCIQHQSRKDSKKPNICDGGEAGQVIHHAPMLFCTTNVVGNKDCVFDCPHFQGLRSQLAGLIQKPQDAMRCFMWHKDQKSICALGVTIAE